MKLPICVFDAKNENLWWTPQFPIDINKIIQIVKNVRDLDIEIEFEDSKKVKL